MNVKYTLLIASGIFGANLLSGAILMTFTDAGRIDSSIPLEPKDVVNGLQVSDLFVGTSLTSFDAPNTFVNNGFSDFDGGDAFLASSFPTQTNEISPLSGFFEFSVTVESGYLLDLNLLEFDWVRLDGGSNGLDTIVVRSSDDGFESDLVNQTLGPLSLNNSVFVDLTGFDTIVDTVTFRFYGIDAGNPSSDLAGFDFLQSRGGGPIILNGAVFVVPEPKAICSLMGVFVLTCAFARRGRR